MWPLGHLAVGYLVYRALLEVDGRHRVDGVAVLALGFGSLFPDLVDKPAAWYLGLLETGRSLAHSLLILVGLAFVVAVFARRFGRERVAVAFAVGAFAHVLVDAIPVLWDPTETYQFLLWPIFTVPSYGDGAPTIVALLQQSMGDPWFYFEFVLLAAALVLWHRDGYPGLLLDRQKMTAVETD